MPILRRVLPALLLAFLSFPLRGQEPASTAPPPNLDQIVANVQAAFEVPGLALAIVKDDKVVVAKGFGLRELGKPTPVDPGTLFGIASNTKAFTATSLALLVEEGKLEWDAPVTRYLPSFQLGGPYVTRELTVRDLLVHRSGLGLGAGDLLWWPPTTYNRKEIVHRLRFLPIQTSFRSAYAYDNVLYLVAGEVIEAVSGKTWEEFVVERILKPVGMTGSKVMHSAASSGGNIATPHARVEGRVRPVKPFDSDNTNPAGGINSNAEDIAKWMQVQLAKGVLPDGSRLFSEKSYRELTTLVTPIPNPDPPPELAAMRTNFRGYALGFEVRDYKGQKVVTHSGSLPGYLSRIFMVPEARLGIAVLTNQESGEAFNSLIYRIADHYLGGEKTDWIAAYRSVQERTRKENEAKIEAVNALRTVSSPSLPLEKYTGTFRDDWYGDIRITREGDHLAIQMMPTPLLVGTLEHWQYDTFIARWSDREVRADAYVTFWLNPDGSIDRARMSAVSPDTDFSFDFHHLDLRPVKE